MSHVNVMNIHDSQEQEQVRETACIYFQIWQIYDMIYVHLI